MALVNLQAPIFVGTLGAQLAVGATNTLDAAGESYSALGYLRLANNAAGPVTLSAAGGGAITFEPSTPITFADAGSTLAVGLQDVGVTGLEDGTFDVRADLVGGTDTITNNTPKRCVMTTGTKTVSAGDLIAVVLELTARGGSDSVPIRRVNTAGEVTAPSIPWGTLDTGTLAKTNSLPNVFIEFDDGTVGWLEGAQPFLPYGAGFSTISFASNSTPDEYACVFQVPFSCAVRGVFVPVGQVATTDDFEVILYSDPLGTPSAQRTTAVDPDVSGNQQGWTVRFATAFTLSINTNYAVAIRPTTTNAIQLQYWNLTSGIDKAKQTLPLNSVLMGSRTNQSGAFATTNAFDVFAMRLIITQLDDGLGIGTADYQMGVL